MSEKIIIEKLNKIIALLELKPATKYINKDGTYKIAEKHCKNCDGLISWDGWIKGNPPIHVDSNGKMIDDGSCPNYESY